MKFLVDNSLSPAIANAISEAGFDAIHVRDLSLQSASDEEIFARASQDDRHLIAADTDFGTLAIRGNQALPSVLLLRMQPCTVEAEREAILRVLPFLAHEIAMGCVVSISAERVRVRRLPLLSSD